MVTVYNTNFKGVFLGPVQNPSQANSVYNYKECYISAPGCSYNNVNTDKFLNSIGNNVQITYRVRNDQSSGVDAFLDIMNWFLPDMAGNAMPEQYLKFGNNANMLRTDRKKALSELPRTKDGKFDMVKIRESLSKAINLIKEENRQAAETLNYGAYRESINSTDLLTAFLGPELAHTIKKKVDDVPEFLTSGISILNATKIFEFVANELDSSDAVKDLACLASVRSANEIKDAIKRQEESLQNLMKFEINNDYDAENFINYYMNITGTAFSCDEIDACSKIYEKPESTNLEKLEAFTKSCGLSENLVDAHKNKIITDVIYGVCLKWIVPFLMNKISNPITKIISTALPTYIEFTETVTKNCPDGQAFNFSQLNYDEVKRILDDGVTKGLIINLMNSLPGLGELSFKYRKPVEGAIGLGVSVINNFAILDVTKTSGWASLLDPITGGILKLFGK